MQPRRIFRFIPVTAGLLLATQFLFAQQPQQPQARPRGWYVADYEGRNKVIWRSLSTEFQSSFPRGGSPVKVGPFSQDERIIYKLSDLKISDPISIVAGNEGEAIIQTASGCFRVSDGKAFAANEHEATRDVQFRDEVFRITNSRLYLGAGGKFEPVLDFGKKGLPDSNVRDMKVSPDGKLYVGTASGIGILDKDGNWSHLTGKQGGLPVNDVNCLSFAEDGTLWVGESIGASRRSPTGEWSYRQGPRWMEGDEVIGILALNNGEGWILTHDSLTRMVEKRMTLREKANYFDKRNQLRHVRHGAVCECYFHKDDEQDSWYMSDNDNDGLWTSIYLGAKCFEYGATKDPEAKQIAKKHFDFLERLETINGLDGYLARSIRPSTYAEGSHEQYGYKGLGKWYESTVEPGWQWKSDTSSDELVGHYFAWSVYYDLVAKGDPTEEERVRRLVRRVTNHLIDHDFALVDVDGMPTRWAVYSPRLLNGDLLWTDEFGLHSLCILSHLKVAIHITDDPKFKEAYHTLIDKYGYNVKQMFAKEMVPNNRFMGINHSDDEMAWLAYYPLLLYPDEDENLTSQYRYSAVRTMRTNIAEKSSFFNMVFGVAFPKWAHIGDAVENLEKWPLDLRTYNVRNLHRDDVIIAPHPNRQNSRRLLAPLSVDERMPEKWNSDPYVADYGDFSKKKQTVCEEDAAAWLLPYWMGVYHGLIEEENS